MTVDLLAYAAGGFFVGWVIMKRPEWATFLIDWVKAKLWPTNSKK